MIARDVVLDRAYADRSSLASNLWETEVLTAVAVNLAVVVTCSIVFRPVVRQMHGGWLQGTVGLVPGDEETHSEAVCKNVNSTFSLGSVVKNTQVQDGGQSTGSRTALHGD